MSTSSILASVALILAAGAVIGGLQVVQAKLARQTMEQAASLAVTVASQTMKEVGPLIAREVGDQIRGYPMAAMTPVQEERVDDLPGGTPSWYGQATTEGDPTEWGDPTDGFIPDEVDWSPEARVAALSELPMELREG